MRANLSLQDSSRAQTCLSCSPPNREAIKRKNWVDSVTEEQTVTTIAKWVRMLLTINTGSKITVKRTIWDGLTLEPKNFLQLLFKLKATSYPHFQNQKSNLILKVCQLFKIQIIWIALLQVLTKLKEDQYGHWDLPTSKIKRELRTSFTNQALHQIIWMNFTSKVACNKFLVRESILIKTTAHRNVLMDWIIRNLRSKLLRALNRVIAKAHQVKIQTILLTEAKDNTVRGTIPNRTCLLVIMDLIPLTTHLIATSPTPNNIRQLISLNSIQMAKICLLDSLSSKEWINTIPFFEKPIK